MTSILAFRFRFAFGPTPVVCSSKQIAIARRISCHSQPSLPNQRAGKSGISNAIRATMTSIDFAWSTGVVIMLNSAVM